MKRYYAPIVACLCFLSGAVSAQVIPPARVGLAGGLTLNPLSPSVQVWRDFANLQPQFAPFLTDSLRFTSGSMGLGGAVGIMGGVPLTKTIHLTGRIGYSSMSGSSTQQQTSGGTTVDHSMSTFMSTLEITPAVEFYGLFGDISLHPLVGFEFGIPLATTVTQDAVASSTGTTTTQDLAVDAEVPDNATRAALLVGLGYTLQLSSNWYLQPEVSYRIALSDVSSAATFSPTSFSQIRIGVNIFFGFTESEKPPTEQRGMSVRMGRISAYDRDGREVDVSELNVEDVRYTEMFPLVPYVFASEGGIPDATQQSTDVMPERGSFQPEALPLDAIEVNRNLLNVIGSRMKQYETATLTITGTTDGKAEAKSKDLAQRRAEWARTYLTTAFAIDSKRVVVRTTPTPAKPSSTSDADGIVENRRVEFSSNVPDVLEPVVITAENQRVSFPDMVMFHPEVDSKDSIQSWTLEVQQAGRVLREINGRGIPDRISWPIRPNELSQEQVPVDYELTLRNTAGDSAFAIGSIPVEYVSSVRKKTENLPDKTVDKYSLILFDFDKATLSEDNSRILERMVLPSIKSTSRVSVIGYTDRIGNEAHNLKLSRERADAVRSFLQSRAKDAKYSVNGVGETSQIYSNDAPVGRQLSRTVQVIVETPRR